MKKFVFSYKFQTLIFQFFCKFPNVIHPIIIIFEKGLKSQKILCKMPCFYRKMSAKIFENNNRFSHLSVLNLWANTIYFTQNVRNYVKTMVFYTLNFFDLPYRSAPFSNMFFTLTCGELFSFTRSVFLGAFFLPNTSLDSITVFISARQH